MAIAFDAGSQPTASTNDPLTWTHTPVGTPRGVFVAVWSVADSTDTVNGVTYGGVAMSEVTGSRQLVNEAGSNDDCSMHLFFLGASIPTGPQTVSVDMTGTSFTHHARCATVTAAGDTEIEDSDGAAADDPSVTLTTAVTTFLFGAGFTPENSTSNIIQSSFTLDQNNSPGPNTGETAYKAGVAAGSPAASITTQAGGIGLLIVAAIKEAAAAGNAARSMHYALEGMR